MSNERGVMNMNGIVLEAGIARRCKLRDHEPAGSARL
jgi:hypothetical protein